MDQYEHIRTAHQLYGQSMSELAYMTGHSRNTIRKALNGEYCGYSPRQGLPYAVLKPLMDTIDPLAAWMIRSNLSSSATLHNPYFSA